MRTLLTLFGSLLMIFVLTPSSQAYLLAGKPVNVVPGGVNDSATCGDRICLDTVATCVNSQCTCVNGEGDGSLYCFNSTYEKTCTVRNDPKVTNFHKEYFDIPSPCRVSLLMYETFFPSQSTWINSPIGRRCQVEVHSFGERNKGKIFIGGFGAYIKIIEGPTKTVKIFNFRGFGHVDPVSDAYKFNTLIKVDGSWIEATTYSGSFGVSYSISIDTANRLIELNVPECALHAKFRPYHPNQGIKQTRVPGIAFGYCPDPDVSGETVWPPGCETTMCGSPMGTSIDHYKVSYGLTTRENAALRTNFITMHQMPNTILPLVCRYTEDLLKGCESNSVNKSVEIIEMCSLILSRPKLVKCLSDNGGDTEPYGEIIMDWFYSCAAAICYADAFQCLEIVYDINTMCPDESVGWALDTDYCNNLSFGGPEW